jgi:uncharacterized metal-binding protein YceD (DUF177 family)
LQAIESLSAEAEFRRHGETVRANGKLAARVVQSCIATGAPVAADVREEFQIEFRPRPAGGVPDEEIELNESELDVVFYDGRSVDLGDAVAETLFLALDPYPRSSGADEVLAEAVCSERATRRGRGRWPGFRTAERG